MLFSSTFLDRNGQLAVLLWEEDPVFLALPQEKLTECQNAPGVYSEQIIDEMLAIHNVGTGTKLATQAEETYKGQRLNELCDHYHASFRPASATVGTVKIWPRPEFESNDNLLSDFLASQENSSEKIEDFKASLRPPLVYTSVYPFSLGTEVEKAKAKQVAFLVDYSGSMSRKPDSSGLTLMQQAIENVLMVHTNYIEVNDSVSLTLFDHQYNEIFPMALKSPAMDDLIRNAPSPRRGGTSFYDSMIKLIGSLPASADNAW